jgi:glycogen synthase
MKLSNFQNFQASEFKKIKKIKNKKEVHEQCGLDYTRPPYPKALSSLPNVPKGPNLGGSKKCSRAHNGGNGVLSSSHH